MAQLSVKGMVLSAMPIGDYDKRLVLLTRERGKVTAFAKGARRQNSPLLAASNPFVFGEFMLYEGRSSYSMARADISHYFIELTSDYNATCYGFYLLEFADYYTRENNDERDMLNLLYVSLKALAGGQISSELIRYIFELRAMVINGEYPQMFSCNHCGQEKPSGVFHLRKGGLVCAECAGQVPGGFIISEAAVYTMQYIIAVPLEKLYRFTVAPEVLRELKRIMQEWTAVYVDRNFKSLEFLVP